MPAKKNHRTLPTALRERLRSGRLTTARPNGQSAKPASLKHWMPNGMVMMPTHITIPAITYEKASQSPANSTQMTLSTTDPAPGGRPGATSGCDDGAGGGYHWSSDACHQPGPCGA